MGICCFSCAQKAAEIFHIREMLYKKGWSGLGFAGRKTTAMTIAATKSSPCFPHWWELLVYSFPVTFGASFLHLQVKSICLFALGVSRAPAARRGGCLPPTSPVAAKLCPAGVRAGLGIRLGSEMSREQPRCGKGLAGAVVGIYLGLFGFFCFDAVW